MNEYVLGQVITFETTFIEDGVAANPTQTITITNEATGATTVIEDGAIIRGAGNRMVATHKPTVVGSYDVCWEAVNPDHTINDVFIVRKKAK
jgi:hypothetical protein